MTRNRVTLDLEEINDKNIYKNVWLDYGDDKVADVIHLIQQNRITK